MTKTAFIAALKIELVAMYAWAADGAKLERFLNSVRETLNGRTTWNHDGDACAKAWQAIGGKGKPTLKALRALPE